MSGKGKKKQPPVDPPPTVIETAKSQETQDTVILVKEDLEAQKFMAAWRLFKPKYVDRAMRDKEALAEAWDEIWHGCEYDMTKLADVAKLPMSVAVREFNRLKNARLIYPDGSLHKTATAILTQEVQGYLKSLLER